MGGVSISTRSLARFEPVAFPAEIVSLVETTARDLALPSRPLPSGAGHDAQMMARICPSGMIFVPSVGGLSHNVREETRPEHLEAGRRRRAHARGDATRNTEGLRASIRKFFTVSPLPLCTEARRHVHFWTQIGRLEKRTCVSRSNVRFRGIADIRIARRIIALARHPSI